MARKAFIFLEFTKERDSCNEMIDILEKCGQSAAANQLRVFNSSPPFMPESYEIELNVIPARVLKMGNSKIFSMYRRPRGKCVIINNLPDLFSKESLRFKNIFEQLLFDIMLFDNLEAYQMLTVLQNTSKIKGDALIVMIISHGHDEEVIGIDGEGLKIIDIVDIFSEKNCKSLGHKPKLFFFNCYRTRTEEKSLVRARLDPKMDKLVIEFETLGQSWRNENKCTFICFYCAEGDNRWFTEGFTFFGQALSHCIAQYSNDRNLMSIMILTIERMKRMGVREKWVGSPEIRLCDMRRELYFNPGRGMPPVGYSKDKE